MKILVQKFGGTSVSSRDARLHAVQHIEKALQQNYSLVVVVSAMGRLGDPYATDTLLQWIVEEGGEALPREQDLLLSCGETISAVTICSILQTKSIPACVLTGAQAGITTDTQFGNAKIRTISPFRVLEQLRQNKVVIVTGFQGCTEDGDITTLGRGGSDTSATAIGAALHAERVDIFTDVPGILTADPRIVGDAKLLEMVTYTEMCNLAQHGAKVIHPRAVEVAMQAAIPLRVRSTFSDHPGTLVASSRFLETQSLIVEDRFVTGITHVPNVTQIQIVASQGQYDVQLEVFKAMARHEISVDFINVNPSGVVYTVFDHVANKALNILQKLGYEPTHQSHCAKVSVIGGGMNGVPGIMAHIVEALTAEDIQILQSADSNATIWVLVHNAKAENAVRALHQKFNLAK